jgi:hypothetical protein
VLLYGAEGEGTVQWFTFSLLAAPQVLSERVSRLLPGCYHGDDIELHAHMSLLADLGRHRPPAVGLQWYWPSLGPETGG